MYAILTRHDRVNPGQKIHVWRRGLQTRPRWKINTQRKKKIIECPPHFEHTSEFGENRTTIGKCVYIDKEQKAIDIFK